MSETRSIQQLLTDWQTAVHNTPHRQPPPYHGPDAAIQMFTEKTSEVIPGSKVFVSRPPAHRQRWPPVDWQGD